MKYYLAGPMTGHPYHNVPAFLEAAETLRERGFDLIVPCELDGDKWTATAMADETGLKKFGRRTWGSFLSRDVKVIADKADAIILLPEWETSKGARLEAFVAINCGYPILFYDNGETKELSHERVLGDINESILR